MPKRLKERLFGGKCGQTFGASLVPQVFDFAASLCRVLLVLVHEALILLRLPVLTLQVPDQVVLGTGKSSLLALVSYYVPSPLPQPLWIYLVFKFLRL